MDVRPNSDTSSRTVEFIIVQIYMKKLLPQEYTNVPCMFFLVLSPSEYDSLSQEAALSVPK